MPESPYIEILLRAIGERYADLRIIQPQAEKAMQRSMQRYGQMTPVIIGCEADQSHEMVDGFKRMRAGRKLGYTSLQARVVPGGRHAMKAAIIHLNTKARTIADVETGMVIRSLHREDMLSQVEIAALLDRHKSFVCRRLKLVEKLSDEVLEYLKLGLINITIGRELSRLPAGNQSKALATVIKYGFTGGETTRLVGLLLQQPQCNQDAILRCPEPVLTDRHPDRPRRDRCRRFYRQLIKMDVFLSGVTKAELSSCQPQPVLAVIERMQASLAVMRKHL